jgi:hypothetical protein
VSFPVSTLGDAPQPERGKRFVFCRRFMSSHRRGDPVCGWFCDLCKHSAYEEHDE